MSKDALLKVANRNHGLVNKLVDGLSDEQALLTIVDGGSHLNWVIAHLVTSRNEMLEALGQPRVRSKAVDDAYEYGTTAPAPAAARPLAEHVADYQKAHEQLVAALEVATEDQLGAPYSRSTVDGTLEFALWHEAYHVGQLTLYRRLAGLKSPIG